MAIWNRIFEIVQNQDEPFSLGFATPSSTGQLSLATPFVFAGTTVKFEVHETSSPSSTLLLSYSSPSQITFGTTTVQGSPTATVSWTIVHTDTASFSPGTYWADLLWINGSTNTYLASGPFVVAATAGR